MPTSAPAASPSPPHHHQPSAEARLALINARAARAVFAASAAFTGVGALLMAWAQQSQGHSLTSSIALWGAFAVISAALCLCTPALILRVGLPAFLGTAITALLIYAAQRGQGVQAVGLTFLPLLLMLAALLTRPLAAVLLTAWAGAGLLALYQAGQQPGRLQAILGTPTSPEPVTDFLGLSLACGAALVAGLLAALRFAQAHRLSAHHEMRYRDLFDRIPSAVVLHDNGRILDANRAALDITGALRRSALIGQDLREYLADEAGRAQFDRRLAELADGREGLTLPVTDVTLRRANGEPLQVRATATLVRQTPPDDLPGGLAAPATSTRPAVLSFMLDDSRRFAAQAETARVRALLEAVLAHSPYIFVLSRRADGVLVEFNAAYEALAGRTRAELLGRTALNLGIWPDHQERDRFIAYLETQGEPGQEQLLRLRRAGGESRFLNATGALLTFDGVEYVLMIGRDITESRRREVEQQAVLQHAPVGVATTVSGVVVSANPRMHEIFGLPHNRMLGLHTRQLWPDHQRHDLVERQVLPELRQRGYARFEEDFRLGDRCVTVRMTASLMPEGDDRAPAVVWIAEDMTQDREVEKALQAAARAAQAASLAKSAFLANMSHELRTPLNGILGLLDMALETDRSAAERTRHVELARESSRLLADLLSDVLDFSRIEAGRLQIEDAPFDLQGLLDSVRAVHTVLAECRGLDLQFSVDLGGQGAHWVRGDALRVRQILNNFLSNALKFTPSGTVQVRAERLRGDAAQLVRLEVRDTGPGIAPAVQARLFQAFEQGDASSTRRQSGTGLGLAICRELAHLMGGGVGVRSEVGQGACFWAELPLSPSVAPADPAELQAADLQLTGLRVLVAEDNPVNMLITTSMLERAGARVEGVQDGQCALHAVLQADERQDPYSLLLMDIQMPGLDGLQATQALRLTHPNKRLPIIALTAGALQSERDAALRAGMDDFVTKPVDRAHLLACVLRHTRAGQASASSCPAASSPSETPLQSASAATAPTSVSLAS